MGLELNDELELDPELDDANDPILGFTALFSDFFPVPFCEFFVLDEDDPDDDEDDGDFPDVLDVLTEPIDGFNDRCKTFSADDDSDGLAVDSCEDFSYMNIAFKVFILNFGIIF